MDRPIQWIEADPLPAECLNCQEEDCWECDTAGKRWYLSHADELRVKRKGLLKSIERLQRQVKAIDEELKAIEDENSTNNP